MLFLAFWRLETWPSHFTWSLECSQLACHQCPNVSCSSLLLLAFHFHFRMIRGRPPSQLPNLCTGTICKAKSMASGTCPVNSIGQEVTNKVPRYSSDSRYSLQVSELFPKDFQVSDSILKNIWCCRSSVSLKHPCVETTSFLVPCLT